MADCKPDRVLRRHGGEVWTCKCGTVGVTFAGVTVRYAPKDFKKLSALLRVAEAELIGAPQAAPAAQVPSAGGSGILH